MRRRPRRRGCRPGTTSPPAATAARQRRVVGEAQVVAEPDDGGLRSRGDPMAQGVGLGGQHVVRKAEHPLVARADRRENLRETGDGSRGSSTLRPPVKLPKAGSSSRSASAAKQRQDRWRRRVSRRALGWRWPAISPASPVGAWRRTRSPTASSGTAAPPRARGTTGSWLPVTQTQRRGRVRAQRRSKGRARARCRRGGRGSRRRG